jgi:MFS family permease
MVSTPHYAAMFESRELEPSHVMETIKSDWRNIVIGAFAPLASFALFHMVTVFPLSWVHLFTNQNPERFLSIEIFGGIVGVIGVIASGLIADRVGRRYLLGVTAAGIAAFSGFAPQLLSAGYTGELTFVLIGFALLGVAFGQSSGAVAANFGSTRRYTGAALTSDLAWLVGAGFAPLVGLLLASNFGLIAAGGYLLSGALATLIALGVNKELGRRIS